MYHPLPLLVQCDHVIPLLLLLLPWMMALPYLMTTSMGRPEHVEVLP
jgi:hypothetical protein